MAGYAIIKLGGKQYVVREGEKLLVDRLAHGAGNSFTPAVLLVGGGGDTHIAPKDITVTARVLADVKGEKIRIGKYRPKNGYKKHTGFRASLSQIEIESIGGKKRAAAAKKTEPAKAEAAKTEVAKVEPPKPDAAPPAPELFEITNAKRSSCAPAQSAAFPRRECPCTATRVASMSGSLNRDSGPPVFTRTGEGLPSTKRWPAVAATSTGIRPVPTFLTWTAISHSPPRFSFFTSDSWYYGITIS